MDTKYYDIGLNLFCRQFKDPDRIINDALDEGIVCILTGSDMKENELVNKYVSAHNCFGTAGIHPHNADSLGKNDMKRIKELISGNSKIVAVGECGLDYDRMFSARENQLECLKKHIDLAEELDKPMFLHERSAHKDLTACFKGHERLCARSVVHCFTGNEEELMTYVDMGFSIGITGWICDNRRSEPLRQAVRRLPLDRLLIETDAPYLTPKGIKGIGSTNIPNNIKYVVQALSKYMDVPEKTIAENAKRNTEKLFSL